jgi:uncharacterized protein YecE (DUF72 family)
MTDYFIGTAGWSYKDWDGIVYPQKKSAGFHALIFLAHYINIIEINSTFYRPPVIQFSLSWIKKVENYPDFLFAVKLHQVFTHKRKGFTQKDVDNFKFGIEPLRAKERLASILIQFPWSFAMEVRHSSWDSADFYKLLSEYNVSFCNIDQPIFRNSIKPSAISTNPEFSYVRLHGRNYKNWFKQDAGRDERYNYLYTKEELEDWIGRIKDLGNKSSKVYIITNNHYQGQALANALQIKNMITGEKLDVPPLLVEQYPVLKELAEKLKEGQLGLFDEK